MYTSLAISLQSNIGNILVYVKQPPQYRTPIPLGTQLLYIVAQRVALFFLRADPVRHFKDQHMTCKAGHVDTHQAEHIVGGQVFDTASLLLRGAVYDNELRQDRDGFQVDWESP